MRIGIIAYGSLIINPGEELEQVIAERQTGLRTPFRVEFARSSSTRNGAPTLVPVEHGGGYVECTLLVLSDGLVIDRVRDIVYRREIHKISDQTTTYQPNPKNPNQVYIETIPEWGSVDLAMYTKISSNIDNLTAERLAELSIESVSVNDATERNDGISYLIDAIRCGVRTPLTDDYIAQILQKTGLSSLEEARNKLLSSD